MGSRRGFCTPQPSALGPTAKTGTCRRESLKFAAGHRRVSGLPNRWPRSRPPRITGTGWESSRGPVANGLKTVGIHCPAGLEWRALPTRTSLRADSSLTAFRANLGERPRTDQSPERVDLYTGRTMANGRSPNCKTAANALGVPLHPGPTFGPTAWTLMSADPLREWHIKALPRPSVGKGAKARSRVADRSVNPGPP